MNISNNTAAINVASFSNSVSAHNVANLSTENYKALEVTKTASKSGPTASVKASNHAPDIATEMIKQMQNNYDAKANIKAIQSHDDMVGTVIDMLAWVNLEVHTNIPRQS